MGNSLGSGQTEDRTHRPSERDNGKELKEEELSTSERPLKTSALANEENEGVFESNRKSQDEGYSSLNSSTFHNGAQAVGPEAVRHASRLGITCTLTDGARKFRQ